MSKNQRRFNLAVYCAIIALLASIYPVRNATDRFNIRELNASNSLSLSASAMTVASGQTIDLTAAMPVVAEGSTTQTLTQIIDPTKVKLTSASDITYPAGWTLSYSTDGTTFSSTAPTTTAGWAAVRAVRATGDLVSSGATAEGRQIATGAATAVAPPSGSFSGGGGGGDGYDVFFDDNNHVFYVYHHGSHPSTAAVNCRTRTGTSCGPGWPFTIWNYINGFYTNDKSTGWIDLANDHLWINTNTTTQTGFACVDISNFTTGPTWCNGTAANSFVGLYPTGASDYNQALGLAASGTRLFTLRRGTDELLCLDTALNGGLGDPCSGSGGTSGRLDVLPTATGQSSAFYADVIAHEGRIYGLIQSQMFCVEAATFTNCANWPKNQTAESYNLFRLPNSSGEIVALCSANGSAIVSCFTPAGESYVLPAWRSEMQLNYYAKNPETHGTRIYWSEGSWQSGRLNCYDVATNNWCPNWGGSIGLSEPNYTITLDPYNPSCLWTNNHQTNIKVWDATTGANSCTTLPASVTFEASVIVPRLGCDATSAVQGWRKFVLTGPAATKYSSATLSITTESGQAIPNWSNIPITSVGGVREIDLSSLALSASGQQPKFVVNFVNRTGSAPADNASATVTAVGEAPELCTRVTAAYVCPTGSGPITALADITATVSVNGSSVLGGATTTLPQVDQSITVTAPGLSSCTSSISGRAGDGGGGSSGAAVSGVTVSLLDSAGNPLLVNGNPVATTTASDGTYSFAGLLPSSYKVRFDEPGVQVLASSTVVSGASGTTTGTSTVQTAATSATSNVAATVVGTGAVVNALFVVPAAATADIPAAGAQGVAQTINVLSNDNAASGSTLTASTVRFCGVSPTQTPPSCSQTTLTTADGSYSVNTSTGVVTFTPNASFTGTVTQPPTYQVTDSASNVVSATITPSVIARPTLTADTSSGAWDQNQTISPLTNDVAGSGATLVATSVKLCGSTDTAPNCTANSLTIAGQGTYTVVADGTITFDPDSSFTGTATPVTYSVTDSVGQKTATTITPTVLVPVAPVANPQSKLVLPTGTAAFTTITGANGLATGTQLSPSQTFLCDVAPNAQTPPNCNATTLTTADGTWVLNQTTGVVTYQPNAGTSTGTKTAVMYQVTDPVGQSASAALTPVIPPAPTANPDTSTGRQAVTQLISLLGNDQPGLPSSPIDVGSVKFCVGNQVAPNCGATSLTVSGEGTYEINSLGIVTFRPLASFLGTATTITYQISDSLGQSASSTLTVTVIPPPVAVATDEVESDTNNTVTSPVPIAIRDLGFGAYGKSIVFEPWANDSGGNKPAGTTQQDPQVVPTSIRLCAVGQSAPNCAATTITTPDGLYTLETSTGKVTFTPVTGFTGTATAPIIYQISNNWSGPSGAATTTAILIPIIGAPGDPLAKNDDTTTKPETPVTLKPIANDTAGSSALNPTTLRLCQETDIAPNCTHLSVTNRHGTYVVNPTTGAVTFTPAKGFTGLATIPYVVSAMNAQTAHAHLTITVGEQAANQSPAGELPQTGSNTTELFALMALLIAIGFIALIKAKKYDLTTKQIADAAQHARS